MADKERKQDVQVNLAPGFGPKYERVKPPKDIKDVPRYLKELLGGFFMRFGYILGLVWQTGKWILFAMSFIALLQGVIPVVSSVILQNILNSLQMVVSGTAAAGRFWDSDVFYFLILYFAVQAPLRIVGSISSAVNRVAGEKVVRYVKTQIMEKSKEIDLASFDRVSFYEKLENANREAGNRPIQILSQMFVIISTLIQLVSYVVIITSAPDMWWAVFVIAAVSIPSALINFVYRRKNFDYVRRRSKDRRQMNYYSELLVNKDLVKEVKMFDIGDTLIGKYQSVFAGYYKGLVKLIRDESIWHTAIAVVTSVSNLVLYILIAIKVFNGMILIGDYSLYTGAVTSIAGCLSSLISTSATIYEGTLFIDNLIAFMKEKATVIPRLIHRDDKPKKVSHGKPHTIEFVHVSFRYPGTEHDVLHDINIKLRPGETAVLVGLNGAGKTTLIKLLTRLYDPTDGVILLDGTDIREYDVKDLYKMFGIIFQDFGKYAVTAGENIHFGDIHREYDESEIAEAAKQSGAADFIEKLERGYDTPLMRIFEPDGLELSIGQWQKMAIARAFYAQSDILILDEPTASLDPMAEQEIFNQFDKLREDKTTIFVSHRLSSATVASLIIVLENGSVVEMGTHAELMDMHGKYYKLFSTQAKRYIAESERQKAVPQGAPAADEHGFDNPALHDPGLLSP